MTIPLKNLHWIEELLPAGTESKKMFGGVAYYWNEKLILILIESGGGYSHKGFDYPFEIWNGCLFPVEKMKQSAVYLKYPFLTSHPATAKWLYLPFDTEDFEERVETIIKDIKKGSPLFGVIPPAAKEKKINSESKDVLDTSKPRAFKEKEKVKTKKPQKKKAVKKEKADTKKIKADKKRENNLVLSVLKRKVK